MLNRRHFLTGVATSAAGVAMAHPLTAHALDLARRRDRGVIDPRSIARSAELKTLAQSALDAARAQGASYAEVRVSLHFSRVYSQQARYAGERCEYAVSVRALKDGYWGFASAPWLSDREFVRVANDAVLHAAGFGAVRPPRSIDWGTIPVEQHGDWTKPAEIPQYEVDPGEVTDAMRGSTSYYTSLFGRRYGRAQWKYGEDPFTLSRIDTVMMSTEGSYIVQTYHMGLPPWGALYGPNEPGIPSIGWTAVDNGLLTLSPTTGWEYVLNLRIEEIYDRFVERVRWAVQLPLKPVEVGRYEVLMDWSSMAEILGATLGPATEMDRALGYEANGVGTSYLGPDVDSYLDASVAASMISICGDRSTAGGYATTQWDVEGVRPTDTDLVRDGRLVVYQAGREAAGWLREMGGPKHRATTSMGMMGIAGGSASGIPLQHLPNLTLAPATDGASFATMLQSMTKGYVLIGGHALPDYQCLNGTINGRLYEVRDGKIVARVTGGAVLFRSPEFWKAITAIGGASSARWSFVHGSKGQPRQSNVASVSTVPALVKDVTLIRHQGRQAE